jgi:hypothetical protein
MAQTKQKGKTMNNPQENQIAMMKTVAGVCNKTPAAWTGLEAFAEAFGRVTGNLDAIELKAECQNLPTAGLTKAKKDARQIMGEAAVTVAGAVHAYATKTKNSDLAEKTDVNLSDFVRGADQLGATKSRVMLTLATENLVNLGKHGITQAKLTVFDQKIAAYEKLLTAPRQVRVDNKSVTAEIAVLVDTNMAILEDELDGLALQIKETNPKFFSDYANARQIIDLGGGHHTDDKTPPTPPPAPK